MGRYFNLIRHDGNRSLFTALEISTLSLLGGLPIHIHVEGLRGTGKTTIIRSAKDILPRIERIKGCPYNCDPAYPHCPVHRSMTQDEIRGIGTEWIRMPFLEISHSAKIGTVVGSIDLGRLASAEKAEAALLPGILPRANRGIVFVDEINRLADTSPELTDILLDVMGTKPGRLQIEEVGFASFEMPITLAVWGASNPDEEPGPLEDVRRQLSDRFDFLVTMGRPGEVDIVREILEANSILRYRERPGGDLPIQADPGLSFRELLLQRSGEMANVDFGTQFMRLLAEIYIDFGLESLRAIESIRLGAIARAALEGRRQINLEDIKIVAPLALRHRVDISTLTNILKFIEEQGSNSREGREAGMLAGGVAEGQKGQSEPDSPPKTAPEQRRMTTGGFSEILSRITRSLTGSARASSKYDVHVRAVMPEDSTGRQGTSGDGSFRDAREGIGQRGGESKLTEPPEDGVPSPPIPARPISSFEISRLIFTEEDLRAK